MARTKRGSVSSYKLIMETQLAYLKKSTGPFNDLEGQSKAH